MLTTKPELIGKFFDTMSDTWVITSASHEGAYATPMSCPTGLTSKFFSADHLDELTLRDTL